MKNKLRDENMQNLMRAMLALETEEECFSFFEDLCTVSELRSMSQRLEVAMKLKRGDVYTDIAASTGASTATISRVSRALSYGADGYNIVLERLENK